MGFTLLIFLAVVMVLGLLLRLLAPVIAQHLKGSVHGWRRLSEVYATARSPSAQSARGQSIVVGQVLYRRCVTVGIGEAGLYLALGFPLSIFGKPPLLIPWSEFKQVEKARLFWGEAACLSIGEPLVGTITVPMSVFETFQPWLRALPFVPA